MKKLAFTTENVKSYYNGDYSQDLFQYFDITRTAGNVLFIGFLTSYHNKKRWRAGSPAVTGPSMTMICTDNETEKNFMFAGIFLHMILAMQSMSDGWNIDKDFHKSSGWPVISAGMAGTILPAYEMLKEADLAPCKNEAENFVRMLDIVSPFMIKEIREFLDGTNTANIDAKAYDGLLKKYNGKVEAITDRITKSIEDIKEQIMNL